MSEEQSEEKKETPKGVSKIQKLRANRKFKLWLIAALMAIVVILFIFFEKLRIVLAIAFIALLAAFGLEASQNDWDLQKLWETKSFEQSKVGRDEKGNTMLDEAGNILFDKMGNVTTDKAAGKKADDYNCDDFSTQPEAQKFFEKVGGIGNDVNRLDGNKDGDACESLPKGGEN
jgi:hypothetical protein